MLLDKVRKTITERKLISEGDRVICAVSGGADSVCLLHVMLRLKEELDIAVYAANVNHLIRGEESMRDSLFVKNICTTADVELFYREYDIPSLSKKLKLGEEECGRKMRYEFFEELSLKLGGAKIATAHNLNDNAETILFRLIRGSSSEGLGGIKYKRDNIIRPLLDINRGEIEKYLYQNGLNWCNDSTNNCDEYSRNNLRLNVFPILNEISHGAPNHIVNAGRYVAQDNEYLDSCAKNILDKMFDGKKANVGTLKNAPEPIKRRMVSKILRTWGAKEISGDKIDDFIGFLDAPTGKEFVISDTSCAHMAYGQVKLAEYGDKESFNAVLNEGTVIENKYWKIAVNSVDKPQKKSNNNKAIFDGYKLCFPLFLRTRKDGDKIAQQGLGGTKKVSDIFSDAKVEKQKRDFIPIIEKNGEILFVCGYRQCANYLPDENTKKYIIIEYFTKE
ncbi:MAG: tRNA lysidine(34) synthetase TilS [Clostridia bacterium]|nr:tRNA lysidine(34) synthetase TilS [Clostridia bacterium]